MDRQQYIRFVRCAPVVAGELRRVGRNCYYVEGVRNFFYVRYSSFTLCIARIEVCMVCAVGWVLDQPG